MLIPYISFLTEVSDPSSNPVFILQHTTQVFIHKSFEQYLTRNVSSVGPPTRSENQQININVWFPLWKTKKLETTLCNSQKKKKETLKYFSSYGGKP